MQPLNCPNCAAPLPSAVEPLPACPYCLTAFVPDQPPPPPAFSPSDKIASELAIVRLREELFALEARLSSAESKRKSAIGCGGLAGLLIALAGCGVIFFTASPSRDPWLIGFVVFGIGFYLILNAWRAARRDRAQSLKARLYTLHRDLAKHKSIVDA